MSLKVIYWFKKNRVVQYISQLNSKLSNFSSLQLNQNIEDIVKLFMEHNVYNDVISNFLDLKNKVDLHNNRVVYLTNTINENTIQNSKKNILQNINSYSIDDIKDIDSLNKEFAIYKIQKDFNKKDVFLQYAKDIDDLLIHFNNIKKQREIIVKIKLAVSSLEDKYIDEDKSNFILGKLYEWQSEAKQLGSNYYTIPKIDKSIIERHNNDFINKHTNDKTFDSVNGWSLDIDQRRAVLFDPMANLVIAGAGAGKTLTICGKTKWLLEKENVEDDEILLLSYSKASAEDLKEKIHKINSNLKVQTFHSLGLEILIDKYGEKRAIEDQYKSYINRFFNEELLNNQEAANLVFEFYSLYGFSNENSYKEYNDEGERFEDLKTADFKTMKDRLKQLSDVNNNLETIQKEYVKSNQELAIANWLFVNGINYEYERSYEYKTGTLEKRQYTPDFYLTDYGIYIEHYGINKEGRAPQYKKAGEQKYLNSIAWKRGIHEENGTICLETFSSDFDDGTIFKKLKKNLEEHNVKLNPLSSQEVSNALNSIIEGQEFASLINLIETFISLYKAQYVDDASFDAMKEKYVGSKYDCERTSKFLDICKIVYNYYMNVLRSQNKIDFDDMILQSIDTLKTTDKYKYRYIIVDEFQDISQSRYKFLRALMTHGNAKLFAVGDDWQAIYRFAGCDVNIFLKFNELFQDAKINYITSTHRNSYELQSVVEPFITANPAQYKKHIKSNIHQENPIRIIYHNADRSSAFIKALDDIALIDSNANVLVLGRNKHDIDCMISKSIQVYDYEKVYYYKYPKMNIEYKTVHQSKGLEADYVVLISGEDARNGFPNKMEDDEVLQLVLGDADTYQYAEERRLFYVALTRTKSIVYVLSDKSRISTFVKEIEKSSKVIETNDAKKIHIDDAYSCPNCKSGHLILRKGKNGKEFYGCSNYPYCTYYIYDLKAVRDNHRCPNCNDFLVMRQGRNGKFFGCHNYPRCKYTCQLNEIYSKGKSFSKNRIGFY